MASLKRLLARPSAGYKIPVIENLGFAVVQHADALDFCAAVRTFELCFAQDGYDSIDLSDNALQKLENFPSMPNLRTLLLNNNMVARIADDMGPRLPALEMLVLTNNKISNLGELDALATLPALHIRSHPLP